MKLTSKIINVMLLSLGLVVTSGCATIVSQSRYPVTINTDPPAAKVEVRDQYGVVKFAGTSPAIATLEAGNGYFTKAQYTVTATKEGYNSSSMPIPTSLDGWYWGNILIGGLIGALIVDPITGAMYEIDSPYTSLTLSPATQVTSALSDDGNLEDRLKQLKALRGTGVLTEAEYQSKKKAILRDM